MPTLKKTNKGRSQTLTGGSSDLGELLRQQNELLRQILAAVDRSGSKEKAVLKRRDLDEIARLMVPTEGVQFVAFELDSEKQATGRTASEALSALDSRHPPERLLAIRVGNHPGRIRSREGLA